MSSFKDFLSKHTQKFSISALHLVLLLISLVFSLTVWCYISIEQFPTTEEHISNIPIDAQLTEYMIRNNLQIVSDVEKSADIRIEGKRYEITGLKSADFTAALDLSSIKTAGTYTLPISISCSEDSDYTVLDMSPQTITVVVDEIVTRTFSVTPTAPDISLSEGYYVDEEEFAASPAAIDITGSASVIDKIAKVEARSTHSGLITESHETNSELYLYGTNGARIVNNDITLSTENISVYIPIYKTKELPLTFKLTNVPPNFNESSLTYKIMPETLTIASPDDSIDNLSVLDIGVIDLTDLGLDKRTTSVPISLPDGYKNLTGSTTARIVWDISDYGKLDFAVSNINFSNVPDNYNVASITNEVTVTVIGPSDELSAMTANDIMITANLLGVSIIDGAQDIPVTVRLRGSRTNCWAIGSYKVTISATPIISEE